MTLKKLLLMTVLVLGSALIAGCSSSDQNGEAKDKTTIRLGHDSSTDSPVQKSLENFKKNVEEKSDGNIEVELFPSGQLGEVKEMMKKVRRGDLQMSLGATTLFTKTFPKFSVWDSFYLFDSADHAHRVLDGKAGKELMKPLETKGLTGLGYMEIGFRNFSNSVRPINELQDLEGLKIRGYSPLQIKAWESLDVSLTNIAWTEVFTSLQQNLIDGQESATSSFYNERFYEAQKYWSMTKHIYTNFLWYANEEFMSQLSEENRELVEEEANKAIEMERELMAEQETEILEELPNKGVEVNEVPLEVRREMGEIMNEAIKEDIIEEAGEDTYKMVMEEVKSERKNE
ncbi:TRAP transporter substrate-binding protein [Salimicrobium flavidum]|uniref:Tripartite ATP-independent transporter solute receptor, DctP family n=1 Tax=Salimicrobium flavidum TaxID=570947 RepID=A0A1N7KR33_9BACI|nr:TRAP transporter substrate-binding protein [Salimicrobium flavidum]SIS64015.1 tripartite ATP-independent transporter solute receptor, DctP family [Salimicrobium flavidum]